MDKNELVVKVKEFVQDHSKELILGGVIAGASITAYYLGKSRGSLDLEVHFHPKGELPVAMPKLNVK